MWRIKVSINGILYTHSKEFETFEEAEKEKLALSKYYKGLFLEKKDISKQNKNLWEFIYEVN